MRALVAALVVAGISGSAFAQTVVCDGTESGGGGPTQYAYFVMDPDLSITNVYIGTEDGGTANYTARMMPPGWTFAIVHNPGLVPFVGPALGDDVAKTRHFAASAAPTPTGACPRLVHFSGPAGLPGGAFTFGFDHPWPSHDVEWETLDATGPTRAVWGAPNGTGAGPVHGPHCPNKFPDGGPVDGPPPDVIPTTAVFRVKFIDGDPILCADLFDPETTIGRSDPFQEGAPPMIVNGCDAAPIVGAGTVLYPLTSPVGLEPRVFPDGFPEGPVTRWEVPH